MPRQARRMSESGYMHLIVRGIGKQTLFEEASDYRYFLSRLERYSLETSVRICAYCLMENHVHLLARDDNKNTPLFMKKLGISYSGYYNKKYDRQGHLFQDRYLSEPIENEAYLLTAFRYILNNPVEAGICPAAEYEWSSYRLYGNADTFVDTTLLFELIGDGERYKAFIAAENDDHCLEYHGLRRDDQWARDVIQKCLGEANGIALQGYERAKRDDALKRLKEQGLSIRQIERLTGINRGVIQLA